MAGLEKLRQELIAEAERCGLGAFDSGKRRGLVLASEIALTYEPVSARHERDAARAARNDRAQEVILLLAMLTKTAWKADAHLSPIAHTHVGSTMNFVVCVHVGSERLAWRISDFEAYEYFRHLKTSTCPPGLSRDAKMARLAALAGQK